jgi:phenylalanine-4-hydroxylase
LGCADQDFDITRMQPQLFVARDFDHLFEVLEAFEATLAWKRGGDYGLEEARRARTVNHLVLAGDLEVTGQVAARIPGPPREDGMATLLAVLKGPVQVSRGGHSVQAEPWPGPALVAFGPADPGPSAPGSPTPGPFALALHGGLEIAGTRLDGHRAEGLRATLQGRPLELPAEALLFVSPGLPGVAGGPGDPEAWDRWFGEQDPFGGGEAEALARRRKAEALPARLGELYLEVARMRAEGQVKTARLLQIREELSQYPDDWLLRGEVGELLGQPGT